MFDRSVSNRCSAKSTLIHGGPGPVAVRKNETSTPDHARVVVSTGDCVDPPRHVASTWKPTYLWLRTSRHWPKPLPINAYVIEHRDGIVLFDTGQDRASVTDPGYFPGGATGIPLRPPRALRHWPRRYAHRPAGGHRLRPRPRTNCRAVPSPPGPPRRAAGLPRCRRRDPGQPPGVAVPTATAAGASRAAALPHPAPWAAVGPHRACANRRSRPGPVHRRPSPVRRRSLALLPTPGHTPGSLSMLVRRPDRPPLLLVDDLTYDAHLLEHGHLPGVGSRRQLQTTTAMTNVLRRRHPDLVILPAHDPGPPAAWQRRPASSSTSTPSPQRATAVMSAQQASLLIPAPRRRSAGSCSTRSRCRTGTQPSGP
jgi:N-acyl homoserine lactone hydrolase